MRHPGARGFACSSTVEVNVLVLGEMFDLFLKIVRLDADRAINALGANVVVSVAAHVDDLEAVPFASSKSRGNLRHLHAGYDVVLPIVQELQYPVGGIDDDREDDQHLHSATGRIKALQSGGQKIPREVAHHQISQSVE